MEMDKKGIILLILCNLGLLISFLTIRQYIPAIITTVSILVLIVTLIFGEE